MRTPSLLPIVEMHEGEIVTAFLRCCIKIGLTSGRGLVRESERCENRFGAAHFEFHRLLDGRASSRHRSRRWPQISDNEDRIRFPIRRSRDRVLSTDRRFRPQSAEPCRPHPRSFPRSPSRTASFTDMQMISSTPFARIASMAFSTNPGRC